MKENTTEIEDEIFLTSSNLSFDVFFNKDPIIDLISNNIQPRLSFIAYNSPKLFKSSNFYNLNQQENCKNKIFLSRNVLSASSIHYLSPKNELINIIFSKQKVRNYFFIYSIFHTIQFN